jgi:hypothetical protein
MTANGSEKKHAFITENTHQHKWVFPGGDIEKCYKKQSNTYEYFSRA